eukprot:m.344446 g.344446  ORF g.344446 m.344446 type:complete len:172 (-) comp24477_c0_seq1:2817-3332(-)
MYGSKLFGTIPTGTFRNMHALAVLQIENSNLHGRFPDIGGTYLYYLTLRNNKFSGSSPRLVGNNSECGPMCKLSQVKLDNNEFDEIEYTFVSQALQMENRGCLEFLDLQDNNIKIVPQNFRFLQSKVALLSLAGNPSSCYRVLHAPNNTEGRRVLTSSGVCCLSFFAVVGV